MMTGNINAHFRHDLDGEWMNMAGGVRTGALDVREVTKRGAQESFAHVAAT